MLKMIELSLTNGISVVIDIRNDWCSEKLTIKLIMLHNDIRKKTGGWYS
jgi:hypothetical protein